MSDKGKFIVLEGIDGCGKSTQAELLRQWLQQKGQVVQHFREPGGTDLGERIRTLFLDPGDDISPASELLLLFAARIQLLHQGIKPALDSGNTVLCERFINSSYAYQGEGGAGTIPEQMIARLLQFTEPYPSPGIILLLDLPVELAMSRRTSSDKSDRYTDKDKEFMEKVRQSYLEQARNSENTHIVDATMPLQQVQTQLQEYTEKYG